MNLSLSIIVGSNIYAIILTLIRDHDDSVRKRCLQAFFPLPCASKRSRSESSSEGLDTHTVFDKDMTAQWDIRHRFRPHFVLFCFILFPDSILGFITCRFDTHKYKCSFLCAFACMSSRTRLRANYLNTQTHFVFRNVQDVLYVPELLNKAYLFKVVSSNVMPMLHGFC